MAEKGFGVKEVNLIGASGTPTITSPNNLNLNANNVAISTNVSIGGTLSVTGNVSVGGTLTYEDVTNIDSVGLITARNGLIVTGVTTTGGITIKAPTSTSVMIGQDAGLNHSGAAQCVGLGYYALRANTNSDFNTAVGTQALGSLGSNSGSSYAGNTAIGHIAGYTMTTGSGNTLLGRMAGSLINSSNNTILGIFDGNSGGLDIRSSSGNIVLADGSGNPRLYINSSGNVGINQVNPASKLDVVGDIKATTFTGSGANLTNVPAATPTNSDIQVAYTVTANGSSAYRFAGNGVVSSADNPDLYLIRGQKYRFINNSGGSHPFQIREASGGSAYSTGVTNNGASSGNIDFAPTYDSPAQLVYQCTSHGGMVGNIYLRDAAGNNTNVGVVTATAFVPTNQNLSHRNKIINGSQQIFQRGTSATSDSASLRSGGDDGYYYGIGDRWAIRMHSSVAQTGFAKDTSDNPHGFGSNQKLVRSNAGSSNVGKYFVYDTRLEGQDLQDFAKGTSSAKEFTLSFYIKTGVSGVYCVELRDLDNARMVGGTYTVSNNNWNRYVITFPADTTGKFDNDNGASLWVRFWLAAGSSFTSGTARTTWGSVSGANLAVGQTAQVGDNVADTWQITGVQLEVGSVATPFELRSHGDELARCQRYYIKDTMVREGSGYGVVTGALDSIVGIQVDFPVTMRTSPNVSLLGTTYRTGGNSNANRESPSGFIWGRKQVGSGSFNGAAYATGGYEASAELG